MDKITQPAEWFETVLPETAKKNPAVLGDFNGTLAFTITGDRGGEWSVTIAEGTVEVEKGIKEGAGYAVKVKDVHFVKLMNGEMSGPVAFATGRLKFRGEVSQAIKLRGLLSK